MRLPGDIIILIYHIVVNYRTTLLCNNMYNLTRMLYLYGYTPGEATAVEKLPNSRCLFDRVGGIINRYSTRNNRRSKRS